MAALVKERMMDMICSVVRWIRLQTAKGFLILSMLDLLNITARACMPIAMEKLNGMRQITRGHHFGMAHAIKGYSSQENGCL